jgi:TRAP-type C4-dicarboxylate transport system substrate-binding protein
MDRYLRRARPVAAVVAAAVVVVACGHVAKIDKAGAAHAAATVIRLQMPEGGDPDGVFFAQDATALSRGALKVVIDSTTYASALPSNEARLVAAMRAGKAGFSYEPAHDWAAVGVAGFEALDAPFLITSVAASQRLAHTALVGTLLGGLKPLGMVGLGLIPNEPRHILSARPLFSAAAFDRVRLRIVDNSQTAALVTALGAVPVQGDSAAQAGTSLISGSITGLETSPTFILSNSYNAEAPYLTSYALVSRFDVISATRAEWAGLTATQQAALRQASTDTLAHSVQVAGMEAKDLTQLCQAGLVLDQPSQAQLNTLVAASRQAMPVGPAAAAMVRRITTSVPGTGATLADIPTPAGCQVARTVAQASSLHRGVTSPRKTTVKAATIPAGTYVTTDTVAEFREFGVTGRDFNKAVTTITQLTADGRVIESQKPDYPDQPVNHGQYLVNGDEVTFFWDPDTGFTPESLHWSYFDGQLTFKIIHVQDPAGQALYLAHPWRKDG